MVTYTLTFEQLQDAFALKSFGALGNIDNWYESLAEAVKSYRPDTYALWSRSGKINRDLHKAYYALKCDLQFFLSCLDSTLYRSALITLTAEQLALLKDL